MQKQQNRGHKHLEVGTYGHMRGMVMCAKERKAGDRSEKYEGRTGCACVCVCVCEDPIGLCSHGEGYGFHSEGDEKPMEGLSRKVT